MNSAACRVDDGLRGRLDAARARFSRWHDRVADETHAPRAAQGLPVRAAELSVLSGRVVSHTVRMNAKALAEMHSERKVSRIKRVLLVEDNPVNQEVALAVLQDLGVEAVSAWSGEEALEKLTADRFEAVLMDCQMPSSMATPRPAASANGRPRTSARARPSSL